MKNQAAKVTCIAARQTNSKPPRTLQECCDFLWQTAQDRGSSPAELAEMVRRLANGERPDEVLAQHTLPF